MHVVLLLIYLLFVVCACVIFVLFVAVVVLLFCFVVIFCLLVFIDHFVGGYALMLLPSVLSNQLFEKERAICVLCLPYSCRICTLS